MVRVRYDGPIVRPNGLALQSARIGVLIPGSGPVHLAFGDEFLVPRSMLNDLLLDPDSRFELVDDTEPVADTDGQRAAKPRAKRTTAPRRRKTGGG